MNDMDPLKTPGDQGLLEVFTPFGVNSAVNHAVLMDDLVELVSTDKCPECGYEGAAFKVYGRIKDREGLGCSSTVEWL